MAITATSSLSMELVALRDLVAQSATFQERIGQPGNAALARERIHLGDHALDGLTLDGARLERPYAIVLRPPGPLWQAVAGGYEITLQRRGTLWLYLCDNSRQIAMSDDLLDFCNFCGGVEDDIAGLAGIDTWLPVTSIELVGTPQLPSIERQAAEEGRWWQVWYALEYGMS